MSQKNKSKKYARSNNSRKYIFISCCLFFMLLVFLDNKFFKHKFQNNSLSNTHTVNLDFEKYHSISFTVINVIDGDTLDINCPDGTNKYTRIRLLGIDAPEMNTDTGEMYFSKESSEFTQGIVLGQKINVYLDEEEKTRGKYGRLLAYIMLADGSFLNEILLSEGFAYADTRFRHSFYNKYQQLESHARSRKKGLWENVTEDQFPEWFRK